MNRSRSFVVITSQRTGSTLLVRSLDSSPKVFCAGEIFYEGAGIHHPEFQYPFQYLGSRKLARLIGSFWQKKRVEDHLRMFYTRAGAGSAAVGFKIMVSQIRTLPAIMPFLQKEGVTCFYLYRRDTFATALSYYKAKVSGIYHRDGFDRPPVAQAVTASEEQFRRLLEACQVDKECVCELQRGYGGRLLTYEDMTTKWDDFIATIGGDIGLSNLRVERALSKISTGGDSVCITNEGILRKKFFKEEPR